MQNGGWFYGVTVNPFGCLLFLMLAWIVIGANIPGCRGW